MPSPARWRLSLLCAMATLLAACDAGLYLSVDVRTDLSPGNEFHAIAVTVRSVDRVRSVETAIAVDAPTLRGVRAADLAGLPVGEHSVEVRLLDATGATVVERHARLELRASHALTLVLARTCRGLACPEGRSCVGGECVDAQCSPLRPDLCPDGCDATVACPAPAASCAEARCVDGVCLAAEVEGACEGDAYCHPVAGCTPAAGPCDGVQELSLDALPRTEWPSELIAPGACYELTLEAEGAFSRGTPAIAPASETGEPVLHVAAAAGDEATITLDFGRTVYDLRFVFEWLSLNDLEQYDERLTIEVDGAAVVPTLALVSSVWVDGTEIRSTAPKGDARVDVGTARTLSIRLRNAQPTDGVGIELHSFELTLTPP